MLKIVRNMNELTTLLILYWFLIFKLRAPTLKSCICTRNITHVEKSHDKACIIINLTKAVYAIFV